MTTVLILGLALIGAPESEASKSKRSGPLRLEPTGLPAFGEQQRYRAELGLPATDQVVKDLNLRWQSGDLPGGRAEGAVFTAQERADLEQRERAGREISVAARKYFSGKLAAVFGGVYIDHGSGKTVVLVTQDVDRHFAALREKLANGERLKILVTRFALVDLERVAAELTAKLPAIADMGVQVTSLGANEKDNMVDVSLARSTPETRAVVSQTVQPTDRSMLRFWEAPGITLTGVDALNAPPLKGGQRISQLADTPGYINICTSGFISYERVRTDALIYVTDYFMVTAGHCARNSNPWSQYSAYPIGTPDRSAYVSGGVDAMRIPINATDMSQRVAITAAEDRLIYYRQNSTADVLNESVCMSGATTGDVVCGVLLSRGITVNSEGRILTDVRVASYSPNQGGDSGGSVLFGSEARGLNSGIVMFNGATRSVFAHISIAISQLGLTNVVGVG